MHDADRRRVSGRVGTATVEYPGDDPSTLARMLGDLIEANVGSRAARRRDFLGLRATVGIEVTDLGQSVVLEFDGGTLRVRDGRLEGRPELTIHADSATIMDLGNLRIGPLGLPVYPDRVGRSVAAKLLDGRLRVEGMLTHPGTLSRLVRVFSVR
ncbi:MAG: SCP2 sterol-binding domain-containing protein [Candidatus Dormibacteraceae bacterium]